MKPIVDIEIREKTYSITATFDLFSQIERITGIGLFAILSNPSSLRLEWISAILYPFVQKDMTLDQLQDFIFENYAYLFAKIIKLLRVGFENSNSEVKQLKRSQTTTDPQKKN